MILYFPLLQLYDLISKWVDISPVLDILVPFSLFWKTLSEIFQRRNSYSIPSQNLFPIKYYRFIIIISFLNINQLLLSSKFATLSISRRQKLQTQKYRETLILTVHILLLFIYIKFLYYDSSKINLKTKL